MKKLFLSLLSLCPLLAWAGDYPCIYLNMRIKNQTQSTCHLIGLELLSGIVRTINDIPLVISEGEISNRFVVTESTFNPLDLVLTYECGANKIVRFESQKGLCRQHATVDGTVLVSTNLDAKFEASNGLYWDNKPGTITWTLTDIS